MKFIITEEQSKLLCESDQLLWVKRRLNKETLEEYIDEAMQNYPTLCDDFKNDELYMDEVINDAVSYFLTTHEDMVDDERYDEIDEMVTDMCYNYFGDWLKEVYIMTCSNR
jgi:hypothetical protein